MKESLFRKSSVNKISSPEQLNDYIKVSNPSVWVVLGAIIVLLISIFVWGLFGNLETSIIKNGIAKNGNIVCYFEEMNIENIKEGMKVKVGDVEGAVISVDKVPLSKEKIEEKLDDYTAYSLSLDTWNYKVIVKADGIIDGICEVSIVLESVKPLSFVFN